jgi:hypothetical protein
MGSTFSKWGAKWGVLLANGELNGESMGSQNLEMGRLILKIKLHYYQP